MDYGVVLSALFWRRFKNKENITFFDPNEVPDLYEAFYSNTELFEELYTKYEKRKDLRKKTMSAEEVFKSGILKERTDTGRIYLVFIDNVMKQGPFDPEYHTIYQSNLCLEVLLPTKSFKKIDPTRKLIRVKKSNVDEFMKTKPTDIVKIRKIK
jgi:ribonucleoside-diphosphate reductase alpha chain